MTARPGWHGADGRPDLTARVESSVDAAGPGWLASRTCPPVRYPAPAEVGGRSAPKAAARDPSPADALPGVCGDPAGVTGSSLPWQR